MKNAPTIARIVFVTVMLFGGSCASGQALPKGLSCESLMATLPVGHIFSAAELTELTTKGVGGLPSDAAPFVLGLLKVCGVGMPKDEKNGISMLKEFAQSRGVDFKAFLMVVQAFGLFDLPEDGYGAMRSIAEMFPEAPGELNFGLGRMWLEVKPAADFRVRAERWLLLSASNGVAPAIDALVALYMDTEQYEAARDWMALGVASGAFNKFPRGFDLMGRLYWQGLGVVRDPSTAVNWYRLAADRNIVNAQLEMANAYEVGVGVPQDSVQAQYWRDKAELTRQSALASAAKIAAQKQKSEAEDALRLAPELKKNVQVPVAK